MSDNTPPPPSSFPNNFSRPSSAAAASSPSFSDSKFKSKRHSLNMSSSSTSSGPRPLHLALGSTIGSSPGSPAPTPSPGPSYATHLSNPAIYDVDVGVDTPTSAQNGFVHSSGSSPRGVAPLPLSPTITGLQQHATSRRQSSISYIPSNSPSHARFSKRDSVDSLNLGLMRSPLSSTYTTSANGGKSPGSGLARSSSLGGRGSRGSRSPAVGERSSTGSILANLNSDTAKGVAHLKERPPVTLAEKHAELLHFIAQKESKCLELRSQLAVHEAELLQLKRKWERIVNRGFEKALSPNSASSSTTSHLPSSPSPSSSVPPGFSTSPNNTASYFPTLNPNNTNAPAAVVLEGIKEGVQGMSRLIAAGLGSIAQVNVVPPANEPKSPGTPEASASTAPLPLRLGSVSQRRTNGSGHGQKESQSSSSTTASTASSTTFSSLLSVSTSSSATSAGSTSGSSASGNTTTTNSVLETSGSFETETESEFGDFEDGQLSLTRRSSTEQVLMVRDTGATPTMSPNPDFQRRRRRNDNVGFGTEDSLSASANATGLLVSEIETNSFDWDDGWDEPAGEIQANEQLYATSSSTASTSTTKPAIADRAKLSLGNGTTNRPKSPLAPASSIPGLAAVSMGVAAPSTQQMSSWVGSVGKRWGEIKGSTAFTKNQKRASILLSDVQQTLVSALISPTPASSNSTTSFTHQTPTASSSSSSSFSSNAFNEPITPSPKIPSTTQPPAQRSMSLLDDSDDESFGESPDENATVRLKQGSRMVAPVMVPDSLSPGAKDKVGAANGIGAGGARGSIAAAAASKMVGGTSQLDAKDADEDEWNW